MPASEAPDQQVDRAIALVRQQRPDLVLAPSFLIPSAHKLYDFRQEPGFSLIAREILVQGRTLLDYNRLFTLWQAVQNTWPLGGTVAEVGTFRGGSARFLAAALRFRSCNPPIHVFDTFTGHPTIVDPTRDGTHVEGGVIVIDDYGFTSCVGLKEAVDQFVKEQGPGRLQGWYMHTSQFVLTRQPIAAARQAENSQPAKSQPLA